MRVSSAIHIDITHRAEGPAHSLHASVQIAGNRAARKFEQFADVVTYVSSVSSLSMA